MKSANPRLPTPDLPPGLGLGLGLGRFSAARSQPNAHLNLNLNLNQSASPSPISGRVSGRLAPSSPPHAYFNFNLNLKDPAPLSPNCFLLSPVKLNAKAFSLTEVVIALGIFAVSMVGVLALFPVASSAGRESSEETQAAILAQTVMGDLRASAGTLGQTNAWMVRGTDTFNNLTKGINLNTSGDYAVAYNIKLRDWADSAGGAPQIGPPIGLKAFTNVSNYSDAVTTPGAVYLSLTRVRPVPNMSGLALITVEVSTPANVALANRRIYTFSSLVAGP